MSGISLTMANAAGAAVDLATQGFMNIPLEWLEWTGVHLSPWKLIGLTGALMFGGRWLVQFIASRRERRPVIPRLFWYMSLLGSAMTLSYFVFSQKQDAVGIVQNLFPAFTAAYSLYLDVRHHGWHRRSVRPAGPALPTGRLHKIRRVPQA